MTRSNAPLGQHPSSEDEQHRTSLPGRIGSCVATRAVPFAEFLYSFEAISQGSRLHSKPWFIFVMVLVQFPRPKLPNTLFSTVNAFGAKLGFERSGAMQSRRNIPYAEHILISKILLHCTECLMFHLNG